MERIHIASVNDIPSLDWAKGKDFSLPAGTSDDLKLSYTDNGVEISDILPATVKNAEELRLLCAFTNTPPASSRLPFSYQKIPPLLRKFVARALGSMRKKALEKNDFFPAWPLDLSTDFLADLSGMSNPFVQGATPVVLSHDLDSAEGLKGMVDLFLSVEKRFKATSTNYIVPCGWPIDHSLLQQIADAGSEVGMHGYDHSNLTPFQNQPVIEERLDRAKSALEDYDVTGYRAPSLLRTKALFSHLETAFSHDSSIPSSGGMFPVPNNGCATARPFMLGNILEIPLSMPRDGSLRFLGYKPEAILSLWIECAEMIADSGGVVVLLTHCEKRFSGNAPMLEIYEAFLKYVSTSDRFDFSSMNRVAQQFKGH